MSRYKIANQLVAIVSWILCADMNNDQLIFNVFMCPSSLSLQIWNLYKGLIDDGFIPLLTRILKKTHEHSFLRPLYIFLKTKFLSSL